MFKEYKSHNVDNLSVIFAATILATPVEKKPADETVDCKLST